MQRRNFITSAVVVAFLISIFTLHGQQLDPVTEWATIASVEYKITPNIVYKVAEGHELKLDVITAGPRTQARPTLIYIHGGGWTQGSKEQYAWWPLPYVARGMSLVNVEYRVANVSRAPAAVEDCRCALRWVYKNAKEYGFDTAKLVVAGHSAGGHLSLATGMLDPSAGFDNDCPGKEDMKVAAIVNFFGIIDAPELVEGPLQTEWAAQWFGSLPNRMELAKQVSPINLVRSGLPPIITIHGTLDQLIPYAQAVRFHAALDRAKVPNQLITMEGVKHGFAKREENLKIQATIFEFLEKQGILAQSKPAPSQ